MAVHYKELGFIFLREGERSSDVSKKTLRVYMYKHHVDSTTNEIVLDLDKDGQMVEDDIGPIAKINWKNDGNGAIKILDPGAYYSVVGLKTRIALEEIFKDYKNRVR